MGKMGKKIKESTFFVKSYPANVVSAASILMHMDVDEYCRISDVRQAACFARDYFLQANDFDD